MTEMIGVFRFMGILFHQKQIKLKPLHTAYCYALILEFFLEIR